MKKIVIALLILLPLLAFAGDWDAEEILESLDILALQEELDFRTNGFNTNVNGLLELFWDFGYTYFGTIISDTLIIVDMESREPSEYAYALSVILEILEIYLEEEVEKKPSEINLRFLIYLADVGVREEGGLEWDYKLLLRQSDVVKYLETGDRSQIEILQSILPRAKK